MEKSKQTQIIAVIASVFLLLIVSAGTFAYFGSFTTNLNNNVAVNIKANGGGDTVFMSNATSLNIQVPASSMSQQNSNDTTAAVTNTATLMVNLTSGSTSVKTTCTYDVVFQYDLNSKVYGSGTTTVTSGATKEITMQASAPTVTNTTLGTNNYSAETNFAYNSSNWTAATTTAGAKRVLVSGATITNTGTTATSITWTFTGKYYNLTSSQTQLANELFYGHIYIDSKGCTSVDA